MVGVPLERVHAIRPSDELRVGDRTLTALRPPLFDNPMSVGLLDGASGTLFSVDSFGAILAEGTQDAGEIPHEQLAGGMVAWSSFDSPWTELVDREKFSQALDKVRRLEPSHIMSSHLPAASGTSIDQFLGVLETLPDAEPFVGPDHEGFRQMVALMTATGQPAQV